MARTITALALATWACLCAAASVSGLPEAAETAAKPAGTGMISKLEALVGQMYNLQSERTRLSEVEAPEPQSTDETMLILDDDSAHRALQSSCTCDRFLSGGSVSSPNLCGRYEAGLTVCMPLSPCPSDMFSCTAAVAASPAARAPVPDAEVITADVHLTAFGASGLPSPLQFQKFFMNELKVLKKDVDIQMSTQGGNVADIRVTVAAKDSATQASIEKTLSLTRTIQVDSFVVDLTTATTGAPTVRSTGCEASTEQLKKEVLALEVSFQDLKKQEALLVEQLAMTAQCKTCKTAQDYITQLGLQR